mgnify:CR=1 FL=1
MVDSSSEDPGYPSDELNVHSPNTRGWQSVKFAEYPQEIGFEIDGGDVRLSQVQILSHQSKIASKVEIFIGQGSSYQTAEFKRLGYLSLDSNERSQYQARELKTVYIDYPGNYVRLIVHRNYVNKQNLFNQVGIVAVNLLGTEGGGGGGDAKNSSEGALSGGHNSNPLNDLSIDINLDPQTASKLRLLSETKARAIATEDYLTAKQIKAVEGELKSMGARLAQLDTAKRQAVGAEDYDRAKEIKDETDDLRGEIERKILAIHIPGVTDNFPQHQSPSYGDYDNRGPTGTHEIMHNQSDEFAAEKEISQKPRFAPSKEGDNDDDPFETYEQTHPNAPVNRSGGNPKGVPLNIDDIPVGAGAAAAVQTQAQNKNDTTERKKRSDNEPVGYNDRGIASSPQEYLPNGDRPIKPKSDNSNNQDGQGYDGSTEENMPERFREEESFPEGQHPLDGVPNYADLPTPEELSGKSKDVSDQSGVTNLVGDYIARCLFSKTWVLREAAITKIHMLLESEYEDTPGISSCLQALATVIRVGAEDKIQQVLFNAVALLDDLLRVTRSAKIGRSVLAPLLDPITANLVEKLADGNGRIREGARRGMDILAASANIGPAVVGAHALRSTNAKQKTAWRPIVARLQLLADLINQYGLGTSSGIMTENVMNFAKSNECFTHSSGEVRDAAKDMTIAVQKLTGTSAIESYLKLLRPKQLEEYMNEFGEGGATVSSQPTNTAAPKKQHAKSSASASKQADGHGSPGAKAQHKMNSPGKKGHGSPGGDEAQDFTTCMFCGVSDASWNEDALDMHYWKDCVLLAPCPACAQVVEVAGMADHLLDECEHKAKYMSCDVTGLAVQKATYDSWKASPECTACAEGYMYCSLCNTSVEDTDDTWRQHLFYECANNTRSKLKDQRA